MCRITALAALLGVHGVFAGELGCPDMPLPHAKLQWVTQNMLYNNASMSVMRFDGEQKVADYLAFYRQAWHISGSPAPIEYSTGAWQVIATAQEKCFYTVQVQSAGLSGSTGLLTVTRALNKPRVLESGKSLPMMSGSTVLNDLGHNDDGRTARTIMLSNGFSTDANADFYRQSLGEQGWKTVSDNRMHTRNGPAAVIVMKREGAETSLVITRKGQTSIVLGNLIDNP